MSRFAQRIRPDVLAEFSAAGQAMVAGDPRIAFAHLERAHVLGQASTWLHVQAHWRMLRWGLRQRSAKECIGQLARIVGAATKTALGWVPEGNTGGTNVSPFRPMPIPDELASRIAQARSGG